MRKNERSTTIPVNEHFDQGRNARFFLLGALDDDDLSEGIHDWFDYCKRMFRKVTKNDLIEFENKYKGSDEEKRDLKRIYLEAEGDMDQIFERHLLTCLEDEDRLRAMIDQMIEAKEVPAFDAYTKETKAKRNKRHKKVGEKNIFSRSNHFS